MSPQAINPPDLGPASGFSHGRLAHREGRVLFVAGQIGVMSTDAGAPTEEILVAQFGEAVRRVLRVVQAAGGHPLDLARMTVFVTNMDLYRKSRKAIGAAWKAQLGSYFPAMSLVEVKSLVDPQALVEIEATAVI